MIKRKRPQSRPAFGTKGKRPVRDAILPVWLLLALFPCSAVGAQMAPPDIGTTPNEARAISLSYVPTGSPTSISARGAFAGRHWTTVQLRPQADRVTWSTTLLVEPGIYPYRLLLNGNRWVTDTTTPHEVEEDGNSYSLLIIPPAGYETLPGVLDDGKITQAGVHHLLTSRYILRLDRTHIALTLRTRHNDVRRCFVVVGPAAVGLMPEQARSREGTGQPAPAGRAGVSPLPMTRVAWDDLFDWWRVTVALPASGTLRYAFQLQDGPTTYLYDANYHLQATTLPLAWFALKPADFPPFQAPEWAQDAVFYRIPFPSLTRSLPLRRASGGPPPSAPQPSVSAESELISLRQHFPYLQALGINALDLSLELEAPVRPVPGANSGPSEPSTDLSAALKALALRAHLHRWHLLLEGAIFPDSLTGTGTTPEALASWGTRWIETEKVDGWRMTTDAVESPFWQTFHTALRHTAPEAYLVADDSGNGRDMLRGDRFDSEIDLPWRETTLTFFARDALTPGRFDALLARQREAYPPVLARTLFHSLVGRTGERLRTLFRREWPREQQAILFQMTYPGTPCIEAGDEIGLESGRGSPDPAHQPWEDTKGDAATLAFYRRVLALRRDHTALRRGAYQTLLTDDKAGVFAFLRTYGHERALVAFNHSDQPQNVTLPATALGAAPLTDWLGAGATLTRQGASVTLTLPPRGIALLGN